MGIPSWPPRRTRTPPCFQANHEGSHVDDVSDRMLAEYAVTCSRRVHGCAVTNFQHIPSNEGTIISVSDRKADAAAGRCSDGAGCSVQKEKNYTWVRRQAVLRGRLLVSVDNPRCHGTLLLEVGTQNSGGTVCLLAHSTAGIGPRFVRDVLCAGLTTCLCQKGPRLELCCTEQEPGSLPEDGRSFAILFC